MDVLDSNRVFPVFLEIKTGISPMGGFKKRGNEKAACQVFGGLCYGVSDRIRVIIKIIKEITNRQKVDEQGFSNLIFLLSMDCGRRG
jgi:hypothetical protein